MRAFFAITAACLIAIATLEGLVRWIRPIPPLPSTTAIGWDAETSPYKWSPDVDPGFLANTRAEVNQLHLRGRPFPPRSPDKVRLLLVGDSQVEAGALPYHDLPEVLLEKSLNKTFGTTVFEVRSIASSGWGQDQQLLALERYYMTFDADYVVLWFTPQNDFWENAFPDRSTSRYLGDLKPTFLLGPDGLKAFEFTPNRNVAHHLLGRFHLYRLVVRVLERMGVLGRAQILRDFDNLIPGPEGHQSVQRQKCPQTVLGQEVYVSGLATYASTPVSIETVEDVTHSRSNFAPFLKRMSKRDEYLLKITQSLMHRITVLAAMHDTKVIVFFNNQIWNDASNDLLRIEGCVVAVGKWYETVNMIPRVERTLAEFNPVELNAKHADMSLDEATVSREDRHLNKVGNRLIFDELAAVLKARRLIKPPVAVGGESKVNALNATVGGARRN